jgi:hypothetical protein
MKYRLKITGPNGSVRYSAQASNKEHIESLAKKLIVPDFTNEVVENVKELNGQLSISGDLITDAGVNYDNLQKSVDIIMQELESYDNLQDALKLLQAFIEVWNEKYPKSSLNQEYFENKLKTGKFATMEQV